MGRWAPPEIVLAALTGDRDATERLISAVWPGCFRLAATVIGDRSLAQDAAQEACAIVYRKAHTLRTADAFDAWLYRVVMREASRVRRRHQSAGLRDYEQSFDSEETIAVDVWRALADLPPELRDVTVLFYFDDLKTEQIASILRIAHATVRTRLARARARLRTLLGDYELEPQAARQEMKQHAV